ncbi:MFS transporter [Bifidobacterium longum]|uniref:MFS transporter n=1 Tax=Bifidobacterium longum TaxID=216816 RepID=UPI001957ACFD|nr:MFS transporter [Bifidobacterium longum]
MGVELSSIIGLFDGSPMRGLAVGLWAGISGVGIVLGPVIGGILLQRFAWDSVFWVCAVIGMLAICAAFLCLFGFIFLTTQWFQALRGCSALETAIATLPFAVVMAVMAAGIALVQGPATDTLMTAVPVGEEGMGSAVNDTIRELGGTLGVGIMGSLQAGAYTTGLTDALRGSHLPQDILGASKESVMAAESISGSLPGTLRRLLDDSVASAFMGGLHSVCLAAMTIALIAAVVAIVAMPKRR